MVPELEIQLEASLTKILQLWKQENESSTVPSVTILSHSVASSSILQLISGLNTIKEVANSLDTVSVLASEHIDFFLNISGELQREGWSLVAVVHCIKSMRFALEACIEGCIATEKNKFRLVKGLYMLTDCIETAILAKHDADNETELLRNTQSTCLQTAHEKITYKNIFESTSNLVLITDEAGTIVEVNPAAKILFSGEGTVDRFCGDLLQVCDDLDRLLELYPPETTNEIVIESGGIKKFFNLHIRLLSKSYPLAKGLLLILSDVTCVVDHRQVLEQRVVERTRALAKSEKLLDSIFQSIGQGILLLDRDLEIIQANRMVSEMYGIPLEVLIGFDYQGLTDTEGLRAMTEACGSLEDGQVQSLECTGLYVDGRKFPSLVTVTSMHLDDKQFWPVIVWDITSQKELEADIVQQKQYAEEMNVTLRNVLKSVENEKREFEENLSARIRSSVLPTINRIRKESDDKCRATYLSVLQEQMLSLTADFTAPMDGDLLKLSRTELRICKYIKAGLTGKEMCDTMNLSFETIQTHRKNIRKKLGLRGKNINLHAFLADRVF